MRIAKRIFSLARNLARRGSVERDLNQEVRSYFELSVEAKMNEGMNEREARRAAAIELGGAEQVKEEVRAIRAGHFIETRLQDIRFAFRTLRKAPVFSLTVALVLALGIGSTTLMFAIVESVLLKDPPFAEPQRIFTLWQRLPQEPRVSFSPKEFTAWQKQTQVFEHLAFVTGTGFTISGRGDPELVIGRMVPPAFFQVLRATIQLGRPPAEAEANERVVVLSHALWRRKFGAQRDVLGQPLTLNGETHTIIGVLPEAFHFDGPDATLFVPVSLSNPIFAEHPDAHFLRVIGRLKPGVTREQLEAEVNLLGTRVNDPEDGTDRRYFALGLKELTTGELRTPLLVLLSAVGFLLLIACANVANLALARGSARQSEIAIRAALGASRARLIAQLLTESTMLALIGGLAGLGVAVWGLDLLRGFATENVPELLRAHVSTPALVFAFGVSALCAILFGLGPSFAASRTSFQAALKGTARTSSSDRTRQALVFGEITVAAVLLIGCVLMMRSFAALTGVDPGFRPADVVTADLVLSQDRYPEAPEMIQFYRKSLDEVRNLPGVDEVGVVTHLPFGGNSWGNGFDVEGYTPPPGTSYSAQIRPVSPGYFAALGIPLKQGNDFSERDREGAPGVAIVNELFAKRFWPNESPIGKRLRYSGDWLSVIGVCGNIKHARLDAESDMELYVAYPQVPGDALKFVGRSLNFVVYSATPGSVSAALRSTLRALDPNAVVKVNTMEALIRASTAQPRFRTWLIAIFSAFALTLACLGIYGVIAYLVTQRYKEIGIRMALGATRTNIMHLILGRTLKLALAGIAAGLVAAFFLSRFLASILFGITTHDAVAFATVPVCLITIALIAGYLPARRATRVNPVTSLRYE